MTGDRPMAGWIKERTVYRCVQDANGGEPGTGCNAQIEMLPHHGSHSHPCPKCGGHMVMTHDVHSMDTFFRTVEVFASSASFRDWRRGRPGYNHFSPYTLDELLEFVHEEMSYRSNMVKVAEVHEA